MIKENKEQITEESLSKKRCKRFDEEWSKVKYCYWEEDIKKKLKELKEEIDMIHCENYTLEVEEHEKKILGLINKKFGEQLI